MTTVIYRYLPSIAVAMHDPKRSSLAADMVCWALRIAPSRSSVLNSLKTASLLSGLLLQSRLRRRTDKRDTFALGEGSHPRMVYLSGTFL